MNMWTSATYQRPSGNIGMLLVEVFLKLWELVQVPLFLPQPFARIAKLPSTSTTVATEARRAAAIAANKLTVKSWFESGWTESSQ